MRTHVLRAVRAIRYGWLVLGISALMLLGIEVAYRSQGYLRASLRNTPAHDTGLDWHEEYMTEEESIPLSWVPYVGYRRVPFEGQYITVDSTRHRLTVQESVDDAIDVFFFGGSTMFGTFQRDAGTIPSVVARRLRELGYENVRVTNFGETGFVFRQGLLELESELLAGARPAVAVFYDGINDVVAVIQNGRAGWPQNAANRERDFEMGRRLYPWQGTIARDAGVLAGIGSVLLNRSQSIQRLLPEPHGSAARETTGLAEALAVDYLATTRFIETLSKAYGFAALYVWQPTIHTTSKVPTEYEQHLLNEIDASELQSQARGVHGAVIGPITDGMAELVPGRFLDLSGLFAGVTYPVYGDAIGHIYEQPSAEVADSLLPDLINLLPPNAR